MEQPTQGTQTWPKNILAVALAVIITAIIVGGGVYWWQMSSASVGQQQIAALQNQIVDLQRAVETKAQAPVAEEAAEIPDVKPTVTSPLSGTTIPSPIRGLKVLGKAKPGTSVWLFPVPEMDPECLHIEASLAGPDLVDQNGNFELEFDFTPSGDYAEWRPREFSVVSMDSNQKYHIPWTGEGGFCIPFETKSDYFNIVWFVGELP